MSLKGSDLEKRRRWNILVSFKTRYSAEQVRYFINVYE
jgi:hypothetical protein